MKQTLKAYWVLSRSFAIPLILVLLFLGTTLGIAESQTFSILDLALAWFGVIMIVYGSHFFNDVWDFWTGIDAIKDGSVAKAYTSASQILPHGLAKPVSVFIVSFLCYLIGTLALIAIGIPMYIIAIGVIFGVGYSAFFKPRGFAELDVFVTCSTTVWVPYVLIAGNLTLNTVLISFVPAMLLVCFVTLDHYEDVESDLSKRIKTLAAILTRAKFYPSRYIETLFTIVIYYHLILTMANILPIQSLLSFFALPIVFTSIATIDKDFKQGIMHFIKLCLSYTALMSVGILGSIYI